MSYSILNQLKGQGYLELNQAAPALVGALHVQNLNNDKTVNIKLEVLPSVGTTTDLATVPLQNASLTYGTRADGTVWMATELSKQPTIFNCMGASDISEEFTSAGTFDVYVGDDLVLSNVTVEDARIPYELGVGIQNNSPV